MVEPKQPLPIPSAAVVSALVAVTVWGASFAATKRLLDELSPHTLLFMRSAMGAAAVSALLAWRGRLAPMRATDWPWLLGLAVLG
ncbi:MAG: EamA family transporter, partial [Candidatus Binatia bacterium]